MFEKEAEEYADKNKTRGGSSSFGDITNYHDLRQGFKDGAEYGYKKAMEEWKRCFLSCSSPYCSKQFPTVESNGVLGNMEKKENDRV